jgi:protein CpxP
MMAKHRLNSIFFSLITCCLLTTATISYAQEPPPPGEHYGQRIFSQLDLSADQRQQLAATKKAHRAVAQKLHQQMKADMDELREVLMNPQLDMTKVNDLHGQIKTLMSQMEDDKLASILAVRSILTPEQFTKFCNLMQKHDKHF